MIDITDQGNPLSEAATASLEASAGHPFPAAYRAFLMRNNGGYILANVAIDVPLLPGSPTDVQEFLGAREIAEWDPPGYGVEPGYVPVARDSGGALFLLSLAGVDAGYVYLFMLFEDWYTSFEENGRMFLVATSFDEFLDNIHEVRLEGESQELEV